MDRPEFVIVFVTTSDVAEANRISHALVEQRKAACVSIVPTVSSLYWWQGKMEKSMESLLIVKTLSRLLDEVIALVKGMHSYENPEVLALPVVGGSLEYLDWLDKETQTSPGA